jgi:hypothetical protein
LRVKSSQVKSRVEMRLEAAKSGRSDDTLPKYSAAHYYCQPSSSSCGRKPIRPAGTRRTASRPVQKKQRANGRIRQAREPCKPLGLCSGDAGV